MAGTNTEKAAGRQTWVSAGTPAVRPYESGGHGGIIIDVGTAYQNVAPATEEHTSGRDRAKALIWRSLPLLVMEFFLAVAITGIAAYLMPRGVTAGKFVLGVLLLWGLAGVVSYLILAERADWYSSAGVEHHRVDAATEVAISQIEADKEVRLTALTAYIDAMAQIESKHQKQIGGPL